MNYPKQDPVMEKIRDLVIANSQKYPTANKKEIVSKVSRQFRFNKKEIDRFIDKLGSKFFIDDNDFFCINRRKKRRH